MLVGRKEPEVGNDRRGQALAVLEPYWSTLVFWDIQVRNRCHGLTTQTETERIREQ